MTHSERLPECEQFQCGIKQDLEKHVVESVPIRDTVKQTKLEVDILKEKMQEIYPKVQNMTFEVFKAGIVGGLVGSMAGEGLKSALLKIAQHFL